MVLFPFCVIPVLISVSICFRLFSYGNEFDFSIHRFSVRCFVWHTSVERSTQPKREKSKRISHLYRSYYYNHYIFTICRAVFSHLFRSMCRCLLHQYLLQQQQQPPLGDQPTSCQVNVLSSSSSSFSISRGGSINVKKCRGKKSKAVNFMKIYI